MPDETPQPIFDYPVISDGSEGSKGQGGSTETVWRFESWDPPYGDPIGGVRITETGSDGFVAHFTFTDSSRPITVQGDIPETDGRKGAGSGRARAKDDGREEEIDIEFRNPKKWG